MIIPVLDEAGVIGEQLASLRSVEGGADCEVVVVDGDPAGSTLRAVRTPGVVTVTAPCGRGAQMNAGAAASHGDALLFLHADTRLPPRGLAIVGETLRGGERVCGAFSLAFDSARRGDRLVARIATLRSRLTRAPYGNQGLFLARNHFDAVGGYRPFPILEDVDFVRRFKRSGGRVVLVSDAVTTSSRRLVREGLALNVLRNTALLLLFAAGVSPSRLSRFYPACSSPALPRA